VEAIEAMVKEETPVGEEKAEPDDGQVFAVKAWCGGLWSLLSGGF